MIANKENPWPTHEGAPDEEALLERSSAPTLRDLRSWAEDRLTTIEAEPDPAPPDDRFAQQAG
jgi:hypothetical protein